ncbi:MAG: hypothetical protein R2706_17420 [Acidimicrobiales bacterium]
MFPRRGRQRLRLDPTVGVLARSSSFGNPISFHTEDRAFHAVDGDPATAWRVGAFTDARGESLSLTWPEGVSAATASVRQPFTLDPNRTITELSVQLDDGEPFVVTLDERSTSPAGQAIELPSVTFDELTLTVIETSAGDRPGYGGLSSVGFAEVWLDDNIGPGRETILTPASLAERTAGLADASPLVVVLARERVSPTSVRDDPEVAIDRTIELPSGAVFDVSGLARLSGRADDQISDAIIRELGGVATEVYPAATSNSRLPGESENRPGVAVDGDLTTIFRTKPGDQIGAQLRIALGTTMTVDSLDLTLLNNSQHSTLTQLTVRGDDGAEQAVSINPGVADGLATTTLRFEPLTTTSLTLTVTGVEENRTREWYSSELVAQPLGIADVAIPGLPASPFPTDAVGECRDDLLRIDGVGVSLRVTGDLVAATTGQPLTIASCEPLELEAGTHTITTRSRALGLAIDRLVLQSDLLARTPGATPAIEVTGRARGAYDLRVEPTSQDYWLVLGESFSEGWTATVAGEGDLGQPILIDGFANGWRIEGHPNQALDVHLEWTPNRTVRLGLWLSLAAVVLCLALACWPYRSSVGDEVAVPGTIRLRSSPGRSWGPSLLAAGAVGLVSGVVTAPLLGVLAALLVVATLRYRRGRLVTAAVALASLGAASAYVVLQQARYHGPHDGAWPSLWERPHYLGLAAIVALAADWAADLVTQHRRDQP